MVHKCPDFYRHIVMYIFPSFATGDITPVLNQKV